MKKYTIFTDASADVSPEFVNEHDIRFVPMHYTLGKEDRISSGPESESLLKRFYDGQRKGDLTQTSQIAPQVYIDNFEPELREGRDVIYLSLSSGITKTFDSVQIAKAAMEDKYPDVHIYPVDTLSAAGSMGIMVERAANNREAGMDIQANVADLEAFSHESIILLMVDDLMYLKRGGRLPASTAVLGTVLGVKPIMFLAPDGKLLPFAKKRGEKTAMKEILRLYFATRKVESGNRIYISHADCGERAEKMAEMIHETDPSVEIVPIMMSPIIGAHTGPGMMSVCYFGDKDHMLDKI